MVTSTFLFYILVGVIVLLSAFLQPALGSLVAHIGHVSAKIVFRSLAVIHYSVGIVIFVYNVPDDIAELFSPMSLQLIATFACLGIAGLRYLDLASWIQQDQEHQEQEREMRTMTYFKHALKQRNRS